jgi:biopolymer transport protein ExbD
MSVEFTCHACGSELKVNERSIGRRVRCPECATLLVVPDPAAGLEELSEQEAEQPDDDIVELEPVETSKPIAAVPPVLQPPPIAPPIAPPLPPAAKPESRGMLRKSQPPTSRHVPLLSPRRHAEDLIDMTAMVDIVFFLLIFFLVTSLQALESVMDMPTPQAAEGGVSTGKSVAELENDPNFITVRIEDDDSIWVEDAQVFNDQELALRLRAARSESGGPRSLLVIGDADASHGAAVRVFDAGAGAGVSGISLIVQEKSESSR